MANIVRIDDEHVFQLPKSPKKDEVLFVQETKRNQFWRRQLDFPQIWYDFVPGFTKENKEATLYNSDGMLISLSIEDTATLDKLLTREINRRKYGCWFMNNGEITYLTGNHYFALQWGEMHGYSNPDTGLGYGEYREFQRDLQYFYDLVVADSNAVGGYIAKAKKTGVTQLIALNFLNESSLIKEKRFTMMSKSHNDAVGTNMMLFQHALEKMPMILKPQLKSAPSLTKVVFDQPKVHISRSAASLRGQLHKSAASGFKTYVEALPTKADATDGPKIWREWFDEFPKCKTPYPQEIYDKGLEGVKLQQQIVGKAFFTSYPPETDTLGFFQGKKIYFDSALSTRNELGQTKSGLLKHFISALNATEGTFDRYGKADKAKAFFMNDTDRKSSTDRRDIQKKTRQYPRTEKEAWSSGGSGSAFDNIRLGEQDAILDEEEKAGAMHYYEGNLDWSNGFGSAVFFTELTDNERENKVEGKFRFYSRLNSNEINVPLKMPVTYEEYNGKRVRQFEPDPNTIMAAGVDPTDYKEKKAVKEGSKNSIVAGMAEDVVRNTMAGGIASNLLICDYLYRADDPDELFEDLCMLLIYLGCYVIVEANRGWLVTSLIKRGFKKFLLLRDRKTGVIRPYKKDDELDLINTTEDLINDYCRAIARYLRKPTVEGEIDYLKFLKSRRGIAQLMDFDPYDTQKSDWVVAMGYMRLAIECLGYVRELKDAEKEKYQPEMMQALVENILNL